MDIEIHFNSINEKNYKQINKKVYDIFCASGNYELQEKLDEESDNINFSFSDIDTGNSINYYFDNDEGYINTEGNNDFIIELIEILLPELFGEYKIDCIFFLESEKGVKDIEDYFRKMEKYIVESIDEQGISISYELCKKINNEEIEKTFKLYEFKKILSSFKSIVQKDFSWLDFIGFSFGLLGLISLFFTADFKDILNIKNSGNNFKILVFIFIIIGLFILFRYPSIKLILWFKRFILRKEIPFGHPEKEAERIYGIRK